MSDSTIVLYIPYSVQPKQPPSEPLDLNMDPRVCIQAYDTFIAALPRDSMIAQLRNIP